MEEKLLHPDKVLDDLGTEVVDRLILASLQSFSSLWLFVGCFFFWPFAELSLHPNLQRLGKAPSLAWREVEYKIPQAVKEPTL